MYRRCGRIECKIIVKSEVSWRKVWIKWVEVGFLYWFRNVWE